jgi:malate/lactate dehydrogenase
VNNCCTALCSRESHSDLRTIGGFPLVRVRASVGCRLTRRLPVATSKLRQAIEEDVRYANITIIEGIGASQLGIGMVSARIAEIVLRDGRAVVPIGAFNPKFGVTPSVPAILGAAPSAEFWSQR